MLIWVDTLRRGHTVGFLAGRLIFGHAFIRNGKISVNRPPDRTNQIANKGTAWKQMKAKYYHSFID